MEIPFTVFVTSSYINRNITCHRTTPHHLPALTTNEVREIAESSFGEIGSHTLYHSRLDQLENREIMDEVQRSKDILEHITGSRVSWFAYPNNYCSPEVIQIVRETGYEGAVCGERTFAALKSDPYHIPRVGVSDYLDSPLFFKGRLHGGFYLIDFVKNGLSKLNIVVFDGSVNRCIVRECGRLLLDSQVTLNGRNPLVTVTESILLVRG